MIITDDLSLFAMNICKSIKAFSPLLCFFHPHRLLLAISYPILGSLVKTWFPSNHRKQNPYLIREVFPEFLRITATPASASAKVILNQGSFCSARCPHQTPSLPLEVLPSKVESVWPLRATANAPGPGSNPPYLPMNRKNTGAVL